MKRSKVFKTSIAGLLTIIFVSGSLPANSLVLYSNLDSDDSYYTHVGSVLSTGLTQGLQFSASATGNVTSIDVAVGSNASSIEQWPQPLIVDLYSDSGSNTLGELQESFTVRVRSVSGSGDTSTGILSGTTTLTKGQKYWLTAAPLNTTNLIWHLNSTGDIGLVYIGRESNNYVDDVVLQAFRINGSATSISEPGPLSLLGGGLFMAALVRRRTKSAGTDDYLGSARP